MSDKRMGQWAYSAPISLGNYYNECVEAVEFQTPLVSVDPMIYEWDTSKSDPSGYRHLYSHIAFKKVLASGAGTATLRWDSFDLGPTNISDGSGISKTRCFTFRLRKLDTPNTRISNMRLWCSDMTDFLTPHTNKVVWETNRQWILNKTFPISYMLNKDKWMPTSLPELNNLFRCNGNLSIAGSGDMDVSEYVYVAVAASGTTPLGEYGSNASISGFRIRITYDCDNLFIFKDK